MTKRRVFIKDLEGLLAATQCASVEALEERVCDRWSVGYPDVMIAAQVLSIEGD